MLEYEYYGIMMKRIALFVLVLAVPVYGRRSSETVVNKINLAFHKADASVRIFDPQVEPTAPGEVVHPDGETWNHVVANADGYTFSNMPLVSAGGHLTTVKLSLHTGYAHESNGSLYSARNKDWALMDSWMGFKNNEYLTVQGLSIDLISRGYRVVVYGDSNSNNRSMSYTIGGETKTIQDSGSFKGDFGSYKVVFNDLHQTSFTIKGNAASSDPRSAICGIQILASDLAVAPTIDRFTVNDTYVTPGTTVWLEWQVHDAQTLYLDPGGGGILGRGRSGCSR